MTTEQTKNFILAGRAVFTISNGRPAPLAQDYTFKVTKKHADGGFGKPLYFVALLTGSDNENDYSYLGILDRATGRARPTAKSSHPISSKPFVALNWALGLIWEGKELPGGARLQHVGRCGKCNRALTVPESIDSGLGPECSGLGYTKPRNERTATARDAMEPRKRRSRKAPKPTFEQLRAQAQAAALAASDGLGLPATPSPAVELITYDDSTAPLPDTLDLGGLYAGTLAGFYAAAAAEDSVDRAERALGVE